MKHKIAKILSILLLLGVVINVRKAYGISTAEGLIELSNEVNNKKSGYEGQTIFLDSDIDFSDEESKLFEPIGNDEDMNFIGTFDGQGHTIRNLEINTSSLTYIGIFGSSGGGFTIRNVVIDSSCSFTSYNKEKTFLGGITGYCRSIEYPCNIENSVSMASITFNGITGEFSSLYIGGIIGNIISSKHESFIKNCANYGPITHSGESYYPSIGGIAGESIGESNKYSILNCVNYGSITHNWKTQGAIIGGIVGTTTFGDIENCVSAGQISYNQTSEEIGSIIGYTNGYNPVDVALNVTHCFWTSDVGYSSTYGSSIKVSDAENSQAELDASLVNELNNYATKNSTWNKWIHNNNNASVSFRVNRGKGHTVNSHVILLPSPAESRGKSFSGWFTNEILTSPFDSNEVESGTTLHGMLCDSYYNVTLDANGGDSSFIPNSHPMAIECNGVYGNLPEPTNVGGFAGWFTEKYGGDKVESGGKVTNQKAHTLYAQWAGKYTLMFEFNNGDEPEVRRLAYNETIVYPTNLVKEGCSYFMWNSSDITNMPAHDLTITARWICHTVAIVFDKVALGSTDAMDVIKDIVGEDKMIIEPFYDDNSTITYIIKFIDTSEEEVKNYIEVISTNEELKPAIEDIKVDGVKWASKSDKHTTAIVSAVVVVVAIIVIAVLILLLDIFLTKRKKFIEAEKLRRGAFSRVMEQETETIDANTFKSRFRKKRNIYPEDYVPPQGIADALVKAGLDEGPAKEAAEICSYNAELSKEKGYVAGHFTLEDAAAVSLYTFDFGGDRYEMNPYRMLNKALRAEENITEEIVKVRDVLYLIMSALRKLPVVSGVTLYRGIRSKVDSKQYKEGSIIVWAGFSSTSPDMNTTKAFLSSSTKEGNQEEEDEGDSGKGHASSEMVEPAESAEGIEMEKNGDKEGKESTCGTLFIIEDGWGYNVQPYSRYPDEEEILLEPEREFEVTSVTDSGDLLLVTLKMKNTKPILKKVFGEGHK